MARSRLGVALLLPVPFSTEVDGLRRALGDGARGRIPPHLTLVPPVNVNDDRMADALAVLRRAAAATSPFTVVLGPPATFLPDNPVLFLRVEAEGGGEAPAVHGLRHRVFLPPLERPLTWPFVPHVTLADGAPPERITAALEALGDYRIVVTFDRLHLLREGDGRVWTPIADVPFAEPAVVGRGGLAVELAVTERLDPEGAALSDREWAAAEGDDRRPLAVTARLVGDVVGVATGWTDRSRGHLSDLMVSTGERGVGVGSHLLAAFTSAAADRGATAITVRAAEGSRAAAFYRGRGWVDHLRLPDWRGGRDFVQLRRRLG